ncbi:hypothetical protein CesoFtcFv8_023787 [Champsocephalus esox]|uniref:Seizure related 6 homolog (mouse)-like n=1 Tax=Champsocephalus esox TaxID=159716 RepID=A0AAN8B4G9_9TELE|nr:hypothetical protein CesoFtcFv8_023787 [Champsocephalus esox]
MFDPLSFADTESPSPASSTLPPSVTLGSTKDSPPESRTSLTGAFLQSVLTQKARLLSQRGGRAALRSAQEPAASPGQRAQRGAPAWSSGAAGEGETSLEEGTTGVTILDADPETEAPSSGVQCSVNFSEPEGYIDSSSDPPPPRRRLPAVHLHRHRLHRVKSVNLSEGELLSIRGADERGAPLVLANHTLLVEGQVIRSPTNQLSVYYRSAPESSMGLFQLHYQIFRLSCSLPKRPHFGEVSVLDLLPGGVARFHCNMGYNLQGAPQLTCLNASLPVWSGKVPLCRALCGGSVKNASVGRVLSPSPHHGPNAPQDRSCSWALEAPKDQRLHLHLERLALGPTDRLVLWSGLDAGSVVLFDSGRGGQIPFEGVISEGPAVRIQFITEQPNHTTGFNVRYEAFERGHCYEPYLQNGNFSTSDPLYGVGAVIQFTCDQGHALEQGPPRHRVHQRQRPVLERHRAAVQSSVWRIHVGEDKRVLLDVQLLNISDSDMLTITDGDEVMTRILGRYVGGSTPFKLFSSTPDLTITFHSDPAGLVFGKGEGFIINYMEVSRNDSCPDLPEIQNGWKTTSHIALVRGAQITYQCDPGYDLVGRETLACQLDLSWSNQPPFCEKIMYCSDPGHVEHSTRTLSDPKLLVGTTIQYSCTAGFILQGGATISCYGREPGTPVWTAKLPHCATEESVSCENPGLPDNGYQILSKRLYLPGESLTFVCYQGYELIGEDAIKCIMGTPSFWSGPLPFCMVARATAGSKLDGGNVALAIFIVVLVLSVLLGGAYVYVTRCRYHSNLRLPLIYPHPYGQITVETEFDNPLYETGGDSREYEVSI